jgi:tetratricopeptide (TPR) repeat protein
MTVTCQRCGAENDDQARFCDQCGGALAGALDEIAIEPPVAPPPSTVLNEAPPIDRKAPASVNWMGLLLIAAVLGGLGYIVFAKPGSSSPQGAQPGEVFQQAQKDIKESKDSLAKDALDVEALKKLYSLYGQIGRGEQLKSYTAAAIAELGKQKGAGKVSKKQALDHAMGIAVAAMDGGDPLAAIDAMKYYYELSPERPTTAAIIASIYFETGDAEKALEWDTRYLDSADPKAAGDDYLGVQVDRATVRLELAKRGQPEQLKEAIKELRAMTTEHPAHWPSWLTFGQALRQSGSKTDASKAYQQALKLAKSPMEKWQSEAAIAELDGKPIPPQPPEMSATPGMPTGENPHGEAMDGAVADPHAGMTPPAGGAAAP